jgi:hypothetical protein
MVVLPPPLKNRDLYQIPCVQTTFYIPGVGKRGRSGRSGRSTEEDDKDDKEVLAWGHFSGFCSADFVLETICQNY